MPMLSTPAFGPRTALAYVTGGTLLCVWTLVWYFTRETEMTQSKWFWVAGLTLTGATFIFLGLVLGRLGRAAREAELPPEEVVRAEAAIQQTAAANPPAVEIAPQGTNGTAIPNGKPGAPAAQQPAPAPASAPAPAVH